MDATFNSEKGTLVLCYRPEETDEASVHLQLLLEDEIRKGHSVPVFKDGFFLNFAASRKKVRVEFNFKNLGFAIIYIEEVLNKTVDGGDNVLMLESFLDEVEDWYSGANTLQ